MGAIVEKDDTQGVWRAIQNPDKHVIVQVAPAVRVALGDEFGMAPGELVTGKMVTALQMIGFDKVFDTNFAADLTILEEGSELLERIEKGGKLPLITSCSPGWVNYVEKHHPELFDNLSSAKSPQQMFGAVSKTYYAEKMGLRAEDIVTVSVMPCTAKKYEAKRDEMGRDGYRDVDHVLTTREIAKLIRYKGVDMRNLPEGEYDSPLGVASGAGAIFGVTGGVMEAALRTAYEVYTGKTLPKLDFTEVRGFEGIKEATIDLDGTSVKVAVAHTLKNAEKVLAHAEDYMFIHGLSRRLHRRRRTAHRHQQCRAQKAHRGPVRAGQEPAPAQEPRKSRGAGPVQRLSGPPPVGQGPRAAAYPLFQKIHHLQSGVTQEQQPSGRCKGTVRFRLVKRTIQCH